MSTIVTRDPRNSPTLRRRRLGRRLKELREQAGQTLEEAADRLYKGRSTLARIESGETRADVHLVRSMMDLYDVRDDRLERWALEASSKGWWRQYGLSDLGYVDMETEACRVLEFSLINIPGLLQTEAYSYALMKDGDVRGRSGEKLRNGVAVRQVRQERLTDDDHPLELHAIVCESALRCAMGGPEVMRSQLEHVLAVSNLPRVTLQVLPLASGAHEAVNGAFIVLEFSEDEDPDLLYVEYPTGSVQAEKHHQVQEAKLIHERLRARALPPEESAALVARLAGELYPHP